MSEPQRILLGLSTSRYSRHLVGTALDEARRLQDQGIPVEIDVLYIIEEPELERVSRVVGDAGFLGLEFQRDLVEMLGSEHHRTALRRVEEIRAAAEKIGVRVNYREVRDEFDDALVAQAESQDYEAIFITRAERPFISRFLFGSESDRVARLFKEGDLGTLIIEDAETEG